MDYQSIYQSKKKSPEKLLELIRDRDYIFVAQAAAEPAAILSHMQHLKNTGVKDVILQTCLPIQNYPVFHDHEMDGILFHNGWFFKCQPPQGSKGAPCQRHSPTFHQRAAQDAGSFDV